MAEQIDVNTLREWLDAKRPVTVVDVRAAPIAHSGRFLAVSTSMPTTRCARERRASWTLGHST